MRAPLLLTIATLSFASSSLALEKAAVPAGDLDRGDIWRAGTTCSLVYYNVCTGWLWVWHPWTADERIGVVYDSCCGSGATVGTSWILVSPPGTPAGYGFTGTISLTDVDAMDCPTNVLASQTFLPVANWNSYSWNTQVGSRFALVAQFGPSASSNPTQFASDHPASEGGSPVACGLCYPTNRQIHSYYWGTPASPLCPGSTLFDGVCDAELMWDVQLTCSGGAVGVGASLESSTWARVKQMYR